MEKVKIPRNVAEAIEYVWSKYDDHEKYAKHLVLNNWNLINATDSEKHLLLSSYADKYPMEYMSALVNGYEIENKPIYEIGDKFTDYVSAEEIEILCISPKPDLADLWMYFVRLDGVVFDTYSEDYLRTCIKK